MKRGVVCLLLVACAPAPVAPKPLTAQEILRETADTYAHAKTYLDRGKQLAANSRSSLSGVYVTFTTAFVRGGRFRFEFARHDEPLPRLIWSDGAQTLSSWSVESGEQESSVKTGLDRALAFSSGTSHMIPALLIPEVGGGLLTAVPDATRGRDETVEGHACWQIHGSRQQRMITLWIDQQTHLIRQVEEQYVFDSSDRTSVAVDLITHYEPAIDAQVGPDQLQPPDTHGQPLRAPEAPAWLGVMFDGHSGTTRVQSVVSGGPAEHAGVQPGDTITKIDAAPVAKAAEVITRVRGEKVGAKLHLTVARGGKELPVDVTLEKRPDLDDLQGRLVGRPAPDFALAPLSGPSSAKLADLKGHVVIVDFWATWCGPCGIAMPHLVDLAHKYKDLRVLGISDEEEADIRKYVADHKIDYTIARDADDVVTGHYLVTGLPTLVIIDKTGVVRALHVGAGDFDAIEAEVQQYLK